MKPIKRKAGQLEFLEITGNPNKGTIILFHGFGADAYDLVPISNIYQGPTWLFPQGPLEIPIVPGYSGRAWFEVDIELLQRAIREKRFDEVSKAFPPELKEAREIAEDLLIQLDLPRSKLILGGFSQGAVLALELALHGVNPCTALLIFSGTIVNEEKWRHLAPLHAHTRFFQSHGFEDPLLPMEKAKALCTLLTDCGLKGELHPFHGGHEIPQSILIQTNTFLTHLLC